MLLGKLHVNNKCCCLGNLLLHNKQDLVVVRESVLQLGDSRVRELTMHLKLLHRSGLLLCCLCGNDLGNELSICCDLLTLAYLPKFSPVYDK